MKKLKGWKTLTFFGLTAFAYLFAWPELTQVLPAKWIAFGSSAIGIILRLVTDGPVGDKGVNA